MRQPLGKIIKLFLILFLTLTASADVKVSVSSPVIYENDIVNFIITADGKNITFPKINDIEGYPIIGESSPSVYRYDINGNITQVSSKTYNFKASKSVTIPSFSVKADGKEYMTKEIKVNVFKPKASKNGSEFVVEMALDSNESYVGEPLTLSVSFKAKINARADQIQLGEPKLENFWVKKIDNVEQSNQGEYMVQTLHYKLFPQKSGEYTIPPIQALVGKIEQRQRHGGFFDDPFFNTMTQQLNWQKIYSNQVKLKVNSLPNGLELYGNYQIKATVDKTKVQANKPINLTIVVKGEGNIDDVKKFNLTLNNVIVYADEPKIKSQEIHGVYQGSFNQKIALIGDQNFTIPALKLDYFDKATKSVKSISTEPIKIEVVGGRTNLSKPSSIEVSSSHIIEAPQQLKNPTKIVIEKEDSYIKYLFLLLGFIMGILFTIFINSLKKPKKKKIETNIAKAIHKAKDDRTLFDILLPYAKKHPIISENLNKLEANIYRDATNKIDKEDLLEIFEDKNIK